VARLLSREPNIRHAGLGHERRRILQEGDEYIRPVRQLSGNETALSKVAERRSNNAGRKAYAGDGMASGAAVSTSGDDRSPASRITAADGRVR
jgi:hypothetical protein